MADDAVGFHAQQAVEKVLNLVLVLEGFRFRAPTIPTPRFPRPRAEHGAPPEVERARWLTSWAADLRSDASRRMRSR